MATPHRSEEVVLRDIAASRPRAGYHAATNEWWCDCERCLRSGTQAISRSTYFAHRRLTAVNQGKTLTGNPRQSLPVIGRARNVTARNENDATAETLSIAGSVALSADLSIFETEDTNARPLCEDVAIENLSSLSQSTFPEMTYSPDGAQPDGCEDVQADNTTEDDVFTCRQELKTTLGFIRELHNATLNESNMSPEDIETMRNPQPSTNLNVDKDLPLKLSLELYHATSLVSESTYTAVVKAIEKCLPNLKLFSYYQIKRRVQNLTGVAPLIHDMCPNTCAAFTGPFKDFEACPTCSLSRWDPTQLAGGRKIPARTFTTIPMGSVLQAFFACPETAQEMRYRQAKTHEIYSRLERSSDLGGEVFDDIFCGTDYLQLYENGTITDDDILLMLSLDGAQLYEHKASDCWIYIWTIVDLAPGKRYKKRYVIPGGFIPGPNKPKNVESFLFPGLHHISALQREMLPIWDAYRNLQFSARPLVYLATADAPGMVYLSGQVGHNGAKGCRKYCGVPYRHKPGSGHYYPVLKKPDGYDAPGSNHPDVNLQNHSPWFSQETYDSNLVHLLQASESNTDYEKRRKATGISKPSIFTGLFHQTLGAPGSFPLDIMHLFTLNIPSLLMDLWRGNMKNDTRNDSKDTWDWAIFRNEEVWDVHGARVASLRSYLPSCYSRPPRNPAEKINSGYKAAEYEVYIYGFLPGLLLGLLPLPYLSNFFKLVRAIRLVSQRAISSQELEEAQRLFVDFLGEYEDLYVQRKHYRMHFVRQCLHTLWHVVPEIYKLGPPGNYAQWTMERTIGNLGQEIRLHSNPYSNISQRGVLRAQYNALITKFPSLGTNQDEPRNTIKLQSGYSLLHVPHDSDPYVLSPLECQAYSTYLHRNNFDFDGTEKYTFRYGRIQLPSGRIVRSLYKEAAQKDSRISRMVKLKQSDPRSGMPCFGEVLYYFQLDIPEASRPHICAMISLTQPINKEIMQLSFNTLLVCTHTIYQSLIVVDIHDIDSLVAFLPLNDCNEFFVLEELGFSVALQSGEEDGGSEET